MFPSVDACFALLWMSPPGGQTLVLKTVEYFLFMFASMFQNKNYFQPNMEHIEKCY